jgi:hypothetical protein
MSEPITSDQCDTWPTDGKLRRAYVMISNGELPPIDRLAVLMTVLGEMTEDNERRAALAYAADFYGFKVYAK